MTLVSAQAENTQRVTHLRNHLTKSYLIELLSASDGKKMRPAKAILTAEPLTASEALPVSWGTMREFLSHFLRYRALKQKHPAFQACENSTLQIHIKRSSFPASSDPEIQGCGLGRQKHPMWALGWNL